MGFIQISLFSLFSGGKRVSKKKGRNRSPSAALRARNTERGLKACVSDPALKADWDRLIDCYFPERQDLKLYHVAWSRRRQRRTLGSCNMTRKRVRMATELNHPEFARWIEPVLYHELCHAVLGTEVFSRCGKRAWHGREFKSLEARHPDTQALNVWMRLGGWTRAVRSARSRAMWKSRG